MRRHSLNFIVARFVLPVMLVLAVHVVSYGQDNKENSEFKLAVNLYNDGMYDLSLQQLKNFIDAYPSTANGIEARFYLGLTQMKLKKYEDARFTFQNFALGYVDHPKAPEAWLKVGDAFTALGNNIEAAAAYERVKTFHSKSPLVPDALLAAARLYGKAGDRERARKMLRTILEDYPKTSSVYPARLALTELYIDDGQLDMAEQETRHIAGSDAPDAIKAGALSLLGRLQMNSSLFDDAEATLRQVTTQYPGTAGASRASFLLGKILLGNLEYKEAGAQFQIVLDGKTNDTPDSVKAEAALLGAQAAAGEKNYSGAVKLFERVLTDFSNSAFMDDALYGAGKAASAKGDASGATGCFTRLIALAGDSPSRTALQRKAWIRLAEAHAQANQWAEAVSAYHSFLGRFPGDAASPTVLLRLGTLLNKKANDPRKAIGVYDELIRTYPRTHEAQEAAWELANCQEAIGSYDDAVATYQMLLADYPASPKSFDAAKRIDFLGNHMVRRRDEAQDKLAKLLGDVLLEKPHAQISVRLADLYYHDLKDYPAAVEQYKNAIDKGLDEKDFIAAYFNRARACHLLSEIDSSAASKAVTYYESFIKQFPNDSLATTSAYFSVMLKLKLRPEEDQSVRIANLLSSNLDPECKQRLYFAVATTGITSPNHAEKFALIDRLAASYPASPFSQEALWIAGSWYQQQGMPDSAIVWFTRGLDKTRNGYAEGKILHELMLISLQKGDYVKATTYANTTVTGLPYAAERQSASHLLPMFLLDGAKYQESITAAKSLADETAQSVDDGADTLNIAFQIAAAYDKAGEKENARKFYQEFLLNHRVSDKAASAYYALGILARAAGKTDIAASYFKQAATHGGQTGASVEIAELLYQNEQYGEAGRQYAELAGSATAQETRREYYSRAIVATLRDNKLSSAQSLTEQFHRQFPSDKTSDAEFTYETGLYYYRQQSYQLANTWFEKGSDFKDTKFYPWSVYYRAKILEVTNQLEDAAKKYDQIIQDFPASDVVPHVLLSLGNMHFNAERYDQAIKYYQTIAEKPDLAGDVMPFAMNNLIQAYESTKLYDAALKTAKDFVSRFPTDESVFEKKIKIGLLYTKLGYYDQAVVHFQNLINESGSLMEAELRYDIGEALYNKADYQQAILEFLKVPYLVSRQGKVNWTATSLYMAGQSYEKLSKFPQALEMYQQIVDRTGIDATFKAAAKKEISRVKTIIRD